MQKIMTIPDRYYFNELKRPWKLTSFFIGMGWLIYGALNYQIADWDVGISIIMGTLTYICAPWSVRIILLSLRERCWSIWTIAALAIAWFVIDGVYVLYHSVVSNTMYRKENFFASTALYFLAGSIWLYRGSVCEFVNNLRSVLRG